MSEITTTPQSSINWFEIPCDDLDRAATFYETMLDTKLDRTVNRNPMAIFPAGSSGIAGTLVKQTLRRPSRGGTMVYLNCNGILDQVLSRVSAAGGLVLLPKTEIPGGHGYKACLRDTEGNHVGLHSI